jgi:DMSO/TMAO reductase YedYZ molybdopterin-dependent catalytic subunit
MLDSPSAAGRRVGSWLASPGLWATGAALIAQRLLHAAVLEAPFAPYSAAEWVVRETPGPVVTWGIEQLGHYALRSTGYIAMAVALVAGMLLGNRPPWLLASLAALLTVFAARVDPVPPEAGATLGSTVIAAVAAYAAAELVRPAPRSAPAAEFDPVRRRLVAGVGLGVGLFALGGVAIIRSGLRSTPSGPVIADTPAVIPNDPAFAPVTGLAPNVTLRDDHYTVDIALENPMVDAAGWRLQVTGLVRTPLALSLDEVRDMETTERLHNLSCISNNVGGRLISNSRWTGVSFDELLERAGVLPEAMAVRARCADGYYEVIALQDIVGREALIAIGMNGRLLPRDHGYPARMLFPDHYGMRNVKWLEELELIADYPDGYWAERGWDRDAVVRTQSRIDVPRDGAAVRSPFECAGIAWAGARGIERVEVSSDRGESWSAAQLEGVLGPFSWRRWQTTVDLPPGRHTITVRAVDGLSEVQDGRVRRPHPSGATGYHRIDVRVG